MKLKRKKASFFLLLLITFVFVILISGSQSLAAEKITGGMTKEEYFNEYNQLNQQQNESWNQKYNFRPDTNVKKVSKWEEFKAAFESDDVSKIILMNDINYTGSSTSIERSESIEIDGQGYLLEMRNSSLNVDKLRDLPSFTKKFSDVPVFHMHDIQIINNSSVGSREGSLSNAWSFVNGRGQYGDGGRSSGRTGLWRYRIGNIYTPYDEKKYNVNQRVGGRLINANHGTVDIWGYNKVITGAENFYTSGINYEPNTYYRGEIAAYNYSTIWFMDGLYRVGTLNSSNMTATEEFNIGQDSFVYLHNTYTGASFPAVYSFYKTLRVGENATYNANVPGTAVSFNVDNAKFIAEKGSTVNLLSRAGGAPTITLSNSNTTNGSPSRPNGTAYEIASDASFYVVGNNRNGVVEFDRNGTISLNNPLAFDIRNLSNNNALGSGEVDNYLQIANSDISAWKNATSFDSPPEIDQSNVALFNIVPTGNNGVVTGTNPTLNSTFIRNQYRRLSGFNGIPELEWEPITDADKSFKARILLGYVPAGGDSPFDENGDAIVIPVYANTTQVGYADAEDGNGNKYTVNTKDNPYLVFTEPKDSFQSKGSTVTGYPYKMDENNSMYRKGENSETKVIDITPPEPAKVTSLVNNASRVLSGTGEPSSKVTVTINGVLQSDMATTVAADSAWSIPVPNKRFNHGDEIQIFLEDNAPQVLSDKKQAAEQQKPYLPQNRMASTNTATGNRNPKEDYAYSDTVFKAATKVIVEDVIPPTPKVDLTARALTINSHGIYEPQSDGDPNTPTDWRGDITKVNNRLTYRTVIQIPEDSDTDSKKIYYNAAISAFIPEGLHFEAKDIKVWTYKHNGPDNHPFRFDNNVFNNEGKMIAALGDINEPKAEAVLINNPPLTYDPATRFLSIGVGDTSKNDNNHKFEKYGYLGDNQYGYLLPGDKIVLEVATLVLPELLDTVINNETTLSGYSQEIVSDDPLEYRKISVTTNAVNNPGGEVTGERVLESAPLTIKFPNTKLQDYNKMQGVNSSDLEEQLVVKDTLKDMDFKVTATLLEDMTYENDSNQVYTLPNSLYIRRDKTNYVLSKNSPVTVFEVKMNPTNPTDDEFNISSSWRNDATSDGLKIKAQQIPQAETYSGKLNWALENTK